MWREKVVEMRGGKDGRITSGGEEGFKEIAGSVA